MKIIEQDQEITTSFGVILEGNASELTQGNGSRFFESDGGRMFL